MSCFLYKHPGAGVILAKLRWGAAVLFSKYTVKVGEVVKSAVKGNLCHGLGGVDEEAGGMPQSNFVQAFNKGSARSLLNKAAERYFRHVYCFCHVG